MEDAGFAHPDAIAAATDVLDRHLAALNSGDAEALAHTLHSAIASLDRPSYAAAAEMARPTCA